jgi:tRNA threonylcarbamoyladenosine biosynthesis protein TsaE
MSILHADSMEFISRSAEQTRRVGLRLGALLRQGDIVHLDGDLGSGKTTFVQGVARGWGSLDPVSSPSFVLVNVYRKANGGQLYHLDAYRLAGPADVDDLDIEDLLNTGPLVVEWAERVRQALPADALRIRFKWVDENQRDLVFSASGQRSQKLLLDLRRIVYGVR